jgi:methanogenic corrinoid protein MtbC1
MEPDFDTLLEQVLAAVMDGQAEPITVLWKLRQTTGDPRIMTLIRAFLAADHIISTTFKDDGLDRSDAALARTMALILAEAADDVELDAETTQTPSPPLRLSDLSI